MEVRLCFYDFLQRVGECGEEIMSGDTLHTVDAHGCRLQSTDCLGIRKNESDCAHRFGIRRQNYLEETRWNSHTVVADKLRDSICKYGSANNYQR